MFTALLTVSYNCKYCVKNISLLKRNMVHRFSEKHLRHILSTSGKWLKNYIVAEVDQFQYVERTSVASFDDKLTIFSCPAQFKGAEPALKCHTCYLPAGQGCHFVHSDYRLKKRE